MHKVGAFGPRADNAHVTFKDIHELRKFVHAGAAQESSEARFASIVGSSPLGITLGTRARTHSPEFVHFERFAVQTDALLAEKNGTAGRQPNGQGDQRKERCQENEHGEEKPMSTCA